MEIRALRDVAGTGHDFVTPMIWPAHGPISGVYGSQRILNGEPRAAAYGSRQSRRRRDRRSSPLPAAWYASPASSSSPATRSSSTTATGLETSYAHLSRIDVTPRASACTRASRSGSSAPPGASTGPHLHWGMEWFEIRLDPQLVVGPMPAS